MFVEETPQKRELYLDNLKVLLTILVIMHHAFITYNAIGGWYLSDPSSDEVSTILFTVLGALNQGFFMGLFFFISAYFVPGSYRRKGAKKYLKDRFVRLGIPLIIYITIVNPIMMYFLHHASRTTFFEFYASYFLSFEGMVDFFGGNGPLWFILMLLIFTTLYCSWRQVYGNSAEKEIEQKAPNNMVLIAIIVLMGTFTFLVRTITPVISGYKFLNIQLANIVQYIIMFILGIMAYRRNWFNAISDKQGKAWLWVAFLSILFLAVVAISAGALEGELTKMMGGWYWESLAFALWESIFCIGMNFGLITSFRKRFDRQGNVAKAMSSNAYAVYLVHAPVLVSISLLFIAVQVSPLIKFVIVVFITILACFAISHFVLRRIPGAKRVLG